MHCRIIYLYDLHVRIYVLNHATCCCCFETNFCKFLYHPAKTFTICF